MPWKAPYTSNQRYHRRTAVYPSHGLISSLSVCYLLPHLVTLKKESGTFKIFKTRQNLPKPWPPSRQTVMPNLPYLLAPTDCHCLAWNKRSIQQESSTKMSFKVRGLVVLVRLISEKSQYLYFPKQRHNNKCLHLLPGRAQNGEAEERNESDGPGYQVKVTGGIQHINQVYKVSRSTTAQASNLPNVLNLDLGHYLQVGRIKILWWNWKQIFII